MAQKVATEQLTISEWVKGLAAHPAYVNPIEPVHKVMNLAEFNQRAVSIHIYSKPFDTCEVYLRDPGTYSDVPLFYTSEYGKLNSAEKLL